MESLTINRVAERHWHALDDDVVVGRGDASPRPDGRIFLSIDTWHGAVFERLAQVMLAELPRPLYTVVDEADLDLTSTWRRAGFATRRREWEYVVPTDQRVTGLGSEPPPGVTTLAVGTADTAPLRALDRAIRAEVEATVGWHDMPVEILSRPVDPERYAVAAEFGEYVGLARVVPLRQPRIGLIAVRADRRRRGIGRALLGEVLGAAHRRGQSTASADVHEDNAAAIALFEGIGARRVSSNLELVIG